MCDDVEDPRTIPKAEVVKTLVDNHRAFLAFIARRVGSRDIAEDILQSALAKSADYLGHVRQSAIAWFYQVLRNAIIDYRRRKSVADRHFELISDHLVANDTHDDELHAVVCQCVANLAGTLKPEYADAIQQVEIEGVSVKDYAERVGITQNNAGVRVFRAREALRKQVVRSCGTCAEHGCLDCTCGGAGSSDGARDAACAHSSRGSPEAV